EYYKLSPKIILQNPRSTIILALLTCMDYRKSFIQTMKTLGRVPFKAEFKAAMPSISQNMPLFHRSSRDFSELLTDLDKNIEITKKGIGGVIDEFEVIRECFYAGFYYEQGKLSAAREHALTACANIATVPGGCSAEIKFCTMMLLAMVFYAEGQKEDADKVISDVRDMVERDKAYYLNANLNAFMFRLRLSNGDKNAAGEWLANHNSNGNLLYNLSFFKIYQYFTTARAYIVIGDYNNAVMFLQKLLQINERYRRTIDVIETCILLAIVYWKKGRGGQTTALEYLERAVKTAYEYKYTQVFANEGVELVNMLNKLKKRAVQEKYADGLPSGFIKTLYIAAVEGGECFKGLTGRRTPENLTFTEKQKTIMRLMCEGLSRNKIAEQTGLKSNTIKSHTELIYKKLDVSSNIDAVLKIKKLHIV
ncbi:MAG: LuxR C-terminal-related transcriptional regulator, partial [Oscillospiraceae bacterium]|nr:LuxR C-terminal-related transcriptional regulator [Oscillospiraceae bacterium]